MAEKPSGLVPEAVRVLVPVAGYKWVSVEPERQAIPVEQREALARFEASAGKRRQRGELPRWWKPAANREAHEPPPWADLHLRPVIAKWPQPVRATFPLRDAPTLYRKFATLRGAEPAALLAFANEHGHLGIGDVESEPIAEWLRAIHAVADTLTAIKAARVRLPVAAQKFINAGLGAHTHACALWNPDRKVLELRVQPRTLLGIVWLQVAELAAGQVADRACAAPGCAAWFQIAKRDGAYRTNRRTCSDACRKRLERGRVAAKAATPRRPASKRHRARSE